MAGRRHHHVWQILQRGFGEKRGKDHHIWVYRKGQLCERTVARLFGMEKHFYGPENSETDAVITEYENESQSTIQDLRKLPNGTVVDSEYAAVLIAHLEMRSAFLRKQASEEMQSAVHGLIDGFQSPKKLRAMMLEYLRNNPEEVDKFLGQNLILPNQRANMAKLAETMVAALSDHEVAKTMAPGLDKLREVANEFPEMVKSGQNKALALSAAGIKRSELHLGRRYSLLRFQEGSFILPDTTLAFATKAGASPFSQADDEIEAVILPIAAGVAIVGSGTGDVPYTLKTINRLLAGCAFQAFVANASSSSLQSLSNRIGKYAKLL